MDHSPTRPEDVLARIKHLRPSTELRQTFQYSNLNYVVLSLIVSTLSGQNFTSFVRDNILDPLGMSDTYYHHEEAEATGRLWDSYFREAVNSRGIGGMGIGKARSIGWWMKDPGFWEAGPGGIITSVSELVSKPFGFLSHFPSLSPFSLELLPNPCLQRSCRTSQHD